MRKKILISAVTVISTAALFVSCSRSAVPVSDADMEYVCTVKENISQIFEPVSFAMSDDGRFVLSDGYSVFLYSGNGEQIRKIGNSGNAKYEYNSPGIVKVYKETIYVWSSATLRFITYNMDGMPLEEYVYDSAITDFEPADDEIIIYTAGRYTDYVVDVYDKSSHSVRTRLSESSPEHKILLHSWAAAPLFKYGDSIFYSSKDNIEICRYDFLTGENSVYCIVDSDSFNVREEQDDKSISRNRQKRSEYLRENPQVVSIFTEKSGDMYLLTLEGRTVVKDEVYDNSGRFFTLYETAKKNAVIARYSYASVGTQVLMEDTCAGLYIIKHDIVDDNDVYTLNKLIIN